MQDHTYTASSYYRLIQPLAQDLLKHGVHRPARDQQTVEFDGPVTITLTSPDAGLFHTAGRQTDTRYLAAELLWYLSRDLSAEYIGHYASLWNHIADEDGNVSSNYGYHMLGEEWKWVRETLISDPWTRQAAIVIHGKEHHIRPNKDVPCTMHAIFHMRRAPFDQLTLDMTVTMRSSDIHYGLAYDIPWFLFYQNQLVKSLKSYFPNLRTGKLRLITHSLHCYMRNYDTLKKMASQPATAIPWPSTDNVYINEEGNATLNLSDAFMRYLASNVDDLPEALQ